MTRIQRISAITAILLVAVVLPGIASAKKSRYSSWYVYSIPFTCGESIEGDTTAIPGIYATAITLTNMSRSETTVGAHVEVTVPAHSKSDRVRRPIAANSAVTIDCDTIANAFLIATPLDTSSYFQGALILESRTNLLNVQVQNTAGGENGVSALTFRTVEAQRVARPRSWDDGDDKVEICHVPPGNPDRAHTIVVDISSVDAHLAHGDYLGRCDDDDD
jgi:hypothetical protein